MACHQELLRRALEGLLLTTPPVRAAMGGLQAQAVTFARHVKALWEKLMAGIETSSKATQVRQGGRCMYLHTLAGGPRCLCRIPGAVMRTFTCIWVRCAPVTSVNGWLRAQVSTPLLCVCVCVCVCVCARACPGPTACR
jgi:hypothetical protein